jgi:hypothetical protein
LRLQQAQLDASREELARFENSLETTSSKFTRKWPFMTTNNGRKVE